MTASPLGKYGEVAATIISTAVVIVWLLMHAAIVPAGDTTAIDTAATLVLGVVLGQRATTNGAGKIAEAAHRRLDAIGAPAANDGVPDAPPAPGG